MSTEKLYRDL